MNVVGLRAQVEAEGLGCLTIDDLQPDDLSHIAWSGPESHLRSVAKQLARVASGEVDYLVVRAPNGER